MISQGTLEGTAFYRGRVLGRQGVVVAYQEMVIILDCEKELSSLHGLWVTTSIQFSWMPPSLVGNVFQFLASTGIWLRKTQNCGMTWDSICMRSSSIQKLP